MARPVKNNADYFSHDCGMRNDLRVKALRRKYSHEGYAVWCYMLEVLTDSDFFEIEWNELNKLLLSADFDIDTDRLCEIIDFCLTLGLLELSDENKLFSLTLKERLNAVLEAKERNRENGRRGGNPNFQKGQRNPYYNAEKDNREDNQQHNPEDNQKITEEITGGYLFSEETLPRDKQNKRNKSKLNKINITSKNKQKVSTVISGELSSSDDVDNGEESASQITPQSCAATPQDTSIFCYEMPSSVDELRESFNSRGISFSQLIINSMKSICRLNDDEVWEWLDRFTDEIKARGEDMKTRRDYQNHFVNWLKIQLEKQSKNGNKVIRSAFGDGELTENERKYGSMREAEQGIENRLKQLSRRTKKNV